MSDDDAVPFEKRRFRTAARHYLTGRPPYPACLIARVAQICALGPGDRVMDLGCGPGQLARAFAPLAAQVMALDPEPEMLRVAQQASEGFGNIEWQLAGSNDLSPRFGQFRLVCMGRSFHWMDRPETLRRLDGMTTPDGAIALFHDTHPEVPDNAWYGSYRDILRRYRDGEVSLHRAPDWMRHEGVLLGSAFSRLEEIGVYERRDVSVDTLLDRALSMSSNSRARLGERADAMIAELRATLPPGGAREVIVGSALLAWRPDSPHRVSDALNASRSR